MDLLGVVMAGGRNVRYGGLKAFAEVGGARIVDRVIAVLRSTCDDIVIITNDPEAYASLGLPMRGDEVTAGAALAGLMTALHWSQERGHDGVVVVACDMPFASAALLQDIVQLAANTGADVVVPASEGPRAVEPLCAFYSNRCAAAIEQAIARGDLRMIGFYDDVQFAQLALERVQTFGDPGVLFMNVNTREELSTARSIAARTGQ